MKRIILCGALLACITPLSDALAIGGRGGGGGGGGGRVGGGGGGAGMARPAGGMSRPSPNISRPSPSINRPSPNINRPSPNINRPSPNINRPSPNISRPSPSINRPSPNIARPSTPSLNLPSGGNQRPNLGSAPNLGNLQRPAQLPANINRPGSGNLTRPDLGNIANRPDLGNLGGGRPDLGNVAGSRPNVTRPTTRPSTNDVGDFLGINVRPAPGRPTTLPGDLTRPALPERPTTLPGNVSRPGLPERPTTLPGDIARPSLPERPTTLPGVTRPALPDRPGIGGGDRPITGGGNRPNLPNRPERPNRPGGGDLNINNRPGWVNIDNDKINNIHNNWNVAVTRPGFDNWPNRHPDRLDHWHNWADGIHNHWSWHGRPCFDGNWWNNHNHAWCGWHYHYWNHNYGWNYWWRAPVWTGVTGWFAGWGWNQPYYYDYGTGGNVVYEGDTVIINNQPVATTQEFAQSAAALATVAPPATEEEAENTEWMPLGTFAVSTNEEDQDPARIVQLAVSKDGIISGTLYNKVTDKSTSVQGRVDKETQRVAMRIASSDDVVIETGIYNLTQDEAPILIHFGEDKTETGLLVRLQQPEEGEGTDNSAGTEF